MNDTEVRPGRWMSQAIEAALKAVVYAEVQNDKAIILAWLKDNQLIPSVNDQ